MAGRHRPARGTVGIGCAVLVGIAAVIAAAVLISAQGDSRSESTAGRGQGTNQRGWMPSSDRPVSEVWAVGDAADGSPASQRVASLIRSNRPDLLLYLGDVYDTGTALEYDRNYRPLYGGLGSITAPTIGNHEWPNVATGYVPSWTAARGTPPPFWYAFSASGWQLISLNSNQPTDPAQGFWLSGEIRRRQQYGNCRIAFMHHPRYSAGPHGDLAGLEGMFDELRGHASIALAGHDHDMQRLHPIGGITPFVDGAGGGELYPVNRDDRRLAFFDDTHQGALRIQLRPGRAVLTFVDQSNETLDRSAVACHQA